MAITRDAVSLYRNRGLRPLLVSLFAHSHALLQREAVREETRHRYRTRLLNREYSAADIPTIRWVDSSDIEFVTTGDPHVDYSFESRYSPLYPHNHEGYTRGCFSWDSIGQVRGGDWDKSTIRFTDLPEYEMFYDVLINGKDWDETRYFSKVSRYLEAGNERKGHTTVEDFRRHRIQRLEELYKSIREDGYKSQEELHPERSALRNAQNEIRVNIGRDGELLFNNNSGNHRLAIAKVLGIDELPVCIYVCHKRWEEKEGYNTGS